MVAGMNGVVNAAPDSFDAGSGVVVGAWVEGKHVGVPDDTGG